MDFPLFVSFVLLFGRQSSISVILTTGRVSPRLWLYWVCTIWAMKYDNKVKVKVKVKSGFSLFFSISLFQKRQARTRSARRQWICVKQLLKIPKATQGTWVAKFYGVVITQLTANWSWRNLILVPRASILLPPLIKRIEALGTRMKESGGEKKRFHARG